MTIPPFFLIIHLLSLTLSRMIFWINGKMWGKCDSSKKRQLLPRTPLVTQIVTSSSHALSEDRKGEQKNTKIPVKDRTKKLTHLCPFNKW